MEETQPTEHEEIPPETDPVSEQEAAEESVEGETTVSPLGTDEVDAVIVTGAVTGRGPGSTMEFQPRRIGLARGLAALSHWDFRIFWMSQLVSLIGTWMQVMAQGWLVLEIGGSAFDLGAVTALQFLPTLALAWLGGVLADQLPKRPLLLGTQFSAMVLAFVLAVLSWTGRATLIDVMIVATLLGFVNAVDMPTRQAFVMELVGRRDLPNAVALNSAGFNAARIAGPALGALLIGVIGIPAVFFVNGVSFLPVLGALLVMKAGSSAVADGIGSGTILMNLREGLSYVRRTPLVLGSVILVALVGTFGMNFSVITPLFARDVLHAGADGFGVLMSAMGVGALVASLMLAFLQWEPHPNLLVGSAAILGLLEVVLSQTFEVIPATILWTTMGFVMIFLTTTANTTLQTSTPDHLRGRVMSVYMTVFVGTTPIGSVFAGSLSSLAGVPASLLVGGVISAIAAFLAWWQMAGGRR